MIKDDRKLCLLLAAFLLPPSFLLGNGWLAKRYTEGFCEAISRRIMLFLCTEVEFLEEIQTEVLRVFLLAIHRQLY
jgi:hypothetical protein